jgi:putative transposase
VRQCPARPGAIQVRQYAPGHRRCRAAVLIEVPAAYTSQTCAECGVVDARSRQDQARFVCTDCGREANADTNAAIIVLKRAG